MPQPTKLTLARDKERDGSRYVNSYTATLTTGGRPIAGKTISFSYKQAHAEEGIRSVATTDHFGQARVDLAAVFAGETDIHASYEVRAQFEPDHGDRELTQCSSDRYFAYAITATRADLGEE